MQGLLLPKAQFTRIGFAPAPPGAQSSSEAHESYDGTLGHGPMAAADNLGEHGPQSDADVRSRGWQNAAMHGEQWQEAHAPMEDSSRHIFRQEQDMQERAGQALPQVGCDWQ